MHARARCSRSRSSALVVYDPRTVGAPQTRSLQQPQISLECKSRSVMFVVARAPASFLMAAGLHVGGAPTVGYSGLQLQRFVPEASRSRRVGRARAATRASPPAWSPNGLYAMLRTEEDETRSRDGRETEEATGHARHVYVWQTLKYSSVQFDFLCR